MSKFIRKFLLSYLQICCLLITIEKEEIPVKSTYSDELIKQYELHKLHLCVTLWKQDSNSGEYHRLDDTPCISELIEEDKDVRLL